MIAKVTAVCSEITYIISRIYLIQDFKRNVRKRDKGMKGTKARKNMKAEDIEEVKLNFNGYFHQY
jgi:hypothetical protein